jgi:hypothetical protein
MWQHCRTWQQQPATADYTYIVSSVAQAVSHARCCQVIYSLFQAAAAAAAAVQVECIAAGVV